MAEPDVQTQLPDAPPAEPVALPPLTPPVIASNDPAVQAQVNAVVAQMTAQLEEQRRMVLEQAQAQFQRELANMQAQQAIQTYAQHITTPTLSRPSGLPGQASDYSAFLASLTADQRKAAQVLFDRILASGLVSFEEIGSAGDGEGARSAKEEHEALVVAEMAKNGNSRVAALQSVNRARPDLYAALNGGR